jgi:hypothetical protein
MISCLFAITEYQVSATTQASKQGSQYSAEAICSNFLDHEGAQTCRNGFIGVENKNFSCNNDNGWYCECTGVVKCRDE